MDERHLELFKWAPAGMLLLCRCRCSLGSLEQLLHAARQYLARQNIFFQKVLLPSPSTLQALRKAVKKFAKHVEPMKPKEGYLGLEIEHPHKYGQKTVQVQP